MAKKTTGSANRFGTRYGAKLRQKVSKVELKSRGTYKCPSCAKTKVKRISRGIWQCQKCKHTFAGKAYEPGE